MEINFIPCYDQSVYNIDSPKPSKLNIPNWYKKIKNNIDKDIKISDTGEALNLNLKMCQPFLDSISYGYIQKTWCDIYIENNDNELKYYFSSQPEIISIREKSSLVQTGFYPYEFVWKMPWITKMPKGWSVLIQHPLNRIDLPFYTLSGVIDSDQYFHAGPGNLPFYIKNEFTGIIPCGTPMYQIIPIKRESWKSSILNLDEKQKKKNFLNQKKYFFGFYKKEKWIKKQFS